MPLARTSLSLHPLPEIISLNTREVFPFSPLSPPAPALPPLSCFSSPISHPSPRQNLSSSPPSSPSSQGHTPPGSPGDESFSRAPSVPPLLLLQDGGRRTSWKVKMKGICLLARSLHFVQTCVGGWRKETTTKRRVRFLCSSLRSLRLLSIMDLWSQEAVLRRRRDRLIRQSRSERESRQIQDTWCRWRTMSRNRRDAARRSMRLLVWITTCRAWNLFIQAVSSLHRRRRQQEISCRQLLVKQVRILSKTVWLWRLVVIEDQLQGCRGEILLRRSLQERQSMLIILRLLRSQTRVVKAIKHEIDERWKSKSTRLQELIMSQWLAHIISKAYDRA
uniref:Uncharacterized protein n=1 Tax=Hanusia phi TaxID=3032 RepID=A0A6T7TNZ6_9CRYP